MKCLTNMNLTKALLQISKEKTLLRSIKVKSLVQIWYYNTHSGRKLTPYHVINSVQIYEKYCSKELLASFHRSGLCISYQSMKQHQQNVARLATVQSNTSKFHHQHTFTRRIYNCNI